MVILLVVVDKGWPGYSPPKSFIWGYARRRGPTRGKDRILTGTCTMIFRARKEPGWNRYQAWDREA